MIKHIASELLMCGLKQFPVVGSAVEFIQGVQGRCQNADFGTRLSMLERFLSNRNPAEAAMVDFFTKLKSSNQNIEGLTRSIAQLQSLGNRGFSVPIFERLFQGNGHLSNLKDNPQMYGRVLGDRDILDSSKILVFIQADKLRIVEVAPFMFAQLMLDHEFSTPTIVGKGDVWALPAKQSQSNLAFVEENEGIELVANDSISFDFGDPGVIALDDEDEMDFEIVLDG